MCPGFWVHISMVQGGFFHAVARFLLLSGSKRLVPCWVLSGLFLMENKPLIAILINCVLLVQSMTVCNSHEALREHDDENI